LLVPLLSAVEEDWLALACFSRLVSRLRPPQSAAESFAITDESATCAQPGASCAQPGAIPDPRVSALRLLLQSLDPQLHGHLQRCGGRGCHGCSAKPFERFQRWFLYDFKFEFPHDDIMLVWETVWAASELLGSSDSFSAFVAMAMLQEYRRQILDRDLDFDQIMQFYDEMGGRHNTQRILRWARELVASVIRLCKARV
uniref:Rab-GAP TBC domain-containing protein n=2 Tax=Macrostomum lignano TaxID=282301 RepID=A0A1I8GPI5_9PLAT